jgi:hypothetical protein
MISSVTLEPMRTEPWLPPADLLVQSSLMMAECNSTPSGCSPRASGTGCRWWPAAHRAGRLDLVDCDSLEAIAPALSRLRRAGGA